MFGIKKTITDNLLQDDEDVDDFTSKKNDKDAKFIFYNDDKKFSKQIELYAVLNNSESTKVLVVIDNTASMDFLSIKITESFDQFAEFANLEGLKAINLTKKGEKQADILLPTTGTIKDCITNGDIIYCDLITNEYWVKATITISEGINASIKFMLSIDLKTRLNAQFKKFKIVLIKCAINCWLENRRTKEKNKHYHYVIKNVKFSTTHQGEFNLNGSKADKIDQMFVNEIFDFKSEIKCQIALVTLEEMLCQELKSITVDDNSQNKLRWGEFKMTEFEMIISNKKFNPETEYFFRYVKSMFVNGNEELEKKAYVYYKANENKNQILGSDINDFNDIDIINTSRANEKKEKYSIVIVPEEGDTNSNTFVVDSSQLKGRKRGMSSANLSSEANNDRRKSIVSINSSNTGDYNKNEDEINLEGYDGNRVKKQVENITARIKKYRDTSRFSNLCKEFNKYINKERYINSICQIYKLNIPKHVLEIMPMPEFRNFTILPGDFLSKKGSLEIEDDNFDEVRINNRNVVIFTIWLFITSFYFMYLILKTIQ